MMIKPGDIIEGMSSVYEVKEKLNEGGMGSVWLAQDLYTGESVIVKLPKPFPSAIKKLRFEAELLSSISHIHIVRYIDFLVINEFPILIESFIPGKTLKQYVKENGPLSEKEVRARLTALLLALDYLESRNIVHRDIKPHNIIVGDKPSETTIIDMGTAMYYNVSGIGELVFSSGGYTAPEQYMGYAFPQSDIWGAMAVALFMLTGNEPATFFGPTYPRLPPKSFNALKIKSNISRRLGEIINKGLSWHVLDRYATAREAIDELNETSTLNILPRFEVMGIVIPVNTPRLIFGRKENLVSREHTFLGQYSKDVVIKEEKEKVAWRVEGDYTIVEISDPYRWISRRHFEIIKYGRNKWCIRDLGSTNRTAIVTRRSIYEVWRGKGVPSPCYPLDKKNLILVAYGNNPRNPPYVTAVFSY